MKTVMVIIGVAALSAAFQGAEPPRCGLRKGLYEQRLALANAPQAPAADGEESGGGSGSATVRAALDREYAAFFHRLSEALDTNDIAALTACCKEAADDRIGALSCNLYSYVAGGRSDRSLLLSTVPLVKKDAVVLWDLNGIVEAGGGMPKAFQPKGPSYRYVDELFLLVLDGQEEAITKYFALAGLASGEFARYMDEKLGVLVRDAPATMVTNWYLIRKHKNRMKAVIQSFMGTATPAQVKTVTHTVQSLCRSDDPDGQEILKMFRR